MLPPKVEADNHVEAIPPAEVSLAARYVLLREDSAEAVDVAAVRKFCNYIQLNAVRWKGWRILRGNRWTAAVLAVEIPGRVAILFSAPPGVAGIAPGGQQAVIEACAAALAKDPLHYAQALVEPGSEKLRLVFCEAGFRRLTRLRYLERDTRYPWVDPPEAGVEWTSYSAQQSERFARTIQHTYKDSLDCPELSGKRPIDDVMAAHRSSGTFSATLWQLASVAGQDVGCLLLSNLGEGSIAEVAYMGVKPEYRGRGLGRALLQRALALCRHERISRLTLAVDDRNHAAIRVYEQLAFKQVGTREVFWHTLGRALLAGSTP